MEYKVGVLDIAQALLDLGGRATTRAIQDRIIDEYCAGATPENYKSERSFRMTIQRKIEDHCPQAADYKPEKFPAKFNLVSRGLYEITMKSVEASQLAEEIANPGQYIEGAVEQITINAYERNDKARQICILYYGYKCSVCSFDFEQFYGERGRSFIHVHHVTPLCTIKSEYSVNPINDLRPVCANCHAMIHRTDPPCSIEELRALLGGA